MSVAYPTVTLIPTYAGNISAELDKTRKHFFNHLITNFFHIVISC
ncbi:hypothetical protein J2X05_004010 [Cellvibrio fibrivorans]|uniref:Uncharacterized protein n=1 Tax=Cellvibrio fibrivorans TaxID=126350 RepID=A0ABU1V3L9_9GAMM|nr:hypothetical protein [Cellvibrio fibrivorans]